MPQKFEQMQSAEQKHDEDEEYVGSFVQKGGE